MEQRPPAEEVIRGLKTTSYTIWAPAGQRRGVVAQNKAQKSPIATSPTRK
jgi:hypothetical protein